MTIAEKADFIDLTGGKYYHEYTPVNEYIIYSYTVDANLEEFEDGSVFAITSDGVMTFDSFEDAVAVLLNERNSIMRD